MSEEDILNHVSEYIVFSHPTLRKLEFGAGGTGTVSLIVHWGKTPERSSLWRTLSILRRTLSTFATRTELS